MRLQEMKRAAAAHAADRLRDGMIVGLGSGSTVALLLEEVAERLRAGRLRRLVGVATSLDTEAAAAALGIPLTPLEPGLEIEVTVDGADEVDPSLDLVKGLGGALLREKMIAQCSRRLVIVVDETKVVDHLGEKSPLPVEVTPFGWRNQLEFIDSLGGEATLRTSGEGDAPFVTDNGNYILDAVFKRGMGDGRALDARLQARAGVVETGLFLGMADLAIIGGKGGVGTLARPDRR